MDDPQQIWEHYRKEHDALVCDFCGILLYPRVFYGQHILKKHNTTEQFVADNEKFIAEKSLSVKPLSEKENTASRFYTLINSIKKQTFTCNVCEKVRDREMVGHFVSYHKLNVYNMIESLQEQKLEKETILTMEKIEHLANCEEEIKMMTKCGVCKSFNLSSEAYALHLAYCSHKSVCYYCQKMWNTIEDLDMHVFREHTRFKCTLGCDNLAYNTYENLKRHYNGNHNKVICIYCNDFVSNESNTVIQHLSDMHLYSAKNSMMFHDCLLEVVGVDEDKSVACTLCDLNLKEMACSVDKLTGHFRDFHRMKWEQILKLIGPNLLVSLKSGIYMYIYLYVQGVFILVIASNFC